MELIALQFKVCGTTLISSSSLQTQAMGLYLVIGMLNGKHWSSVITYRELNSRIILVRRSRKAEVNV